jgi:hypothetical protein
MRTVRGSDTNVFTLLSTVFVVTGAGMSVLARRHFVRRRAFVRDSTTATGVIVGFREDRNRDEISYFPKIRFRTPAGREVTFESGAGSSHTSLQVGDTVEIRYRRDQPEIAEVASFAALWGPTLLFGMLGVIFLIVGIGILSGWLPV